MMNWHLNEVFGQQPHKDTSTINFYLFLSNGEYWVETIDTNYPMGYIESEFTKQLISMNTAEYGTDQSVLTILRKRLTPTSALHLIFDRDKADLYLSEDNKQLLKANRGEDGYRIATLALKALGGWLVSDDQPKTNLFGELDKSSLSLVSNNKFWINKNFSIYSLMDLPAIISSLENSGKEWKGMETASIFIFDYNDEQIREVMEKQIGNGFLDRDASLCLLNFNIGRFEVQSPSIIVDSNEKGIFEIQNAIKDVLLKKIGVTGLPLMKARSEAAFNSGYSVQDIYYTSFKDAEHDQAISNAFNSGPNKEAKAKMAKIFKDYKIFLGDTEMRNFLLSFFIFKEIFPLSDAAKQYKTFFTIIGMAKPPGAPGRNPSVNNQEVFDAIFTAVGDPVVGEDKLYYLISSRFCFPKRVFSLFFNVNDSSDATMHDVIEFNQKNGMVSGYSLTEGESDTTQDEKAFYNLKVAPHMQKAVIAKLGDKVRDNRVDEKVMIKSLSEFPDAHSQILQSFESYGVEYQDINVIMTFSPGEAGQVAGYASNTFNDQEAVSLARGHRDFKMPFIIMNTASPQVSNREKMTSILIHEADHYLHDMLILKGELDKSFNDIKGGSDAKTHKEQIQNHLEYLRSPSETEAHTVEALSVLRAFSVPYLIKNWHTIKSKIIAEEFEVKGELAYQVVIKEYSGFVEEALRRYIKEVEVSNPPPE